MSDMSSLFVSRYAPGSVNGPAIDLFAGDAKSKNSEKVNDAAGKLGGTFMYQLIQAMRKTVPEDGLVDGGRGEDIFQGFFDQYLAEELSDKVGFGDMISDTLTKRANAAKGAL